MNILSSNENSLIQYTKISLEGWITVSEHERFRVILGKAPRKSFGIKRFVGKFDSFNFWQNEA